jgi:hypothetical protein
VTSSVSAGRTLDREFLGVRARLLELAAALDRIDRDPAGEADRRLDSIQASLKILLEATPNRAERVQLAFSLPYLDAWRSEA